MDLLFSGSLEADVKVLVRAINTDKGSKIVRSSHGLFSS
jgi:hypothetical protein